MAEITDLVDLGLWPEGTRMIVRREEPHPGAQLTFSDVDGHRYQLFITDHPEEDVAFLEALYRGRGRCERRICDAKDTGLENLPSASFAINEAWLALVLIAADLLAWMQRSVPRGRSSKGRAQAPALHAAAQRGDPRALGPTDHLAHRRGLALGRRPRRCVRAPARVGASDHLNARRLPPRDLTTTPGPRTSPCVSTVVLGGADTAYRPAKPGQRPRSTGSVLRSHQLMTSEASGGVTEKSGLGVLSTHVVSEDPGPPMS